ncbi:MAG: hypothetical protein ABSC77_14805 [Terracidiphilus sp.]|jgi:hypothetical protein
MQGDGKMLRVKIWTPKTGSDRRLVQEELSAILASPHFSSSKRYPALLRYVVEKCLDGQSDQLKERTLGIEVFGRPPDYDTNAEPVVRITAAEVRKRIAQYYHEATKESEIQIGLPLGSYTPEFRTKHTPSKSSPNRGLEPLPGTADFIHTPIRSDAAGFIEQSRSRFSRALPQWLLRRPLAWSIGLGLILISLGAYFVHRALSMNREAQLWAPLVQTQDPVLIVIGSGKLWLITPESPQTSLTDHMIGPYHHVSVPDTIAVSRLANVLQKHNRNYFIKEVSATSLADIRERTVIFVGALNNAWTMRLTDPLRFRFVPGNVARIEDTKNPQNSAWSVDYSKPYPSLSVDYGIVARYHDTYTNGNVLIIAGIGPYGTEAASEFVSSPQYLSQVEHFIPAGLKEANLEIVIKTDVINGEAGPPHVIAACAF